MKFKVFTMSEKIKSWNLLAKIYDSTFPEYSEILRFKTLCGDLSQSDVIFIAAFSYANNIELKILSKALELNPKSTPDTISQIKNIFEYWSDENDGYERRNGYFTYIILARAWLTLNKEVLQKN